MKTLRAGLVKRIHVDRQVIAQNRKNGTSLPHWTIQTSKGPIKCSEWWLTGRLAGSPPGAKQLSCGARVYMTTVAEVQYE